MVNLLKNEYIILILFNTLLLLCIQAHQYPKNYTHKYGFLNTTLKLDDETPPNVSIPCLNDSDCIQYQNSELAPVGSCCIEDLELECGLNTSGGVCKCNINGIECNNNNSSSVIFVSPELNTLKWIFIFIIVGYPIITLIFAIFENGRENIFIGKFFGLYKWIKGIKSKGRSINGYGMMNMMTMSDEDLINSDDDNNVEIEVI